MTLKIYNTATKQLTPFTPIGQKVRVYTCGPTVYDYPHVGNWVAYIYWDILVRTLLANDYDVERVINITDVGHLTGDNEGDADTGEDKLEKGARREGKNAWQVAEFYTQDFIIGMKKLGLIQPQHIAKATDYLPEQFELIRLLKEKGYTYKTSDGIYFNTAKFPRYGDFARLNTDELKAGARVEFNPEKRSASDFALWKFTPEGVQRDMEWQAPDWLIEDGPESGFPGWHLECSAIAMRFLGSTLDIHTGGIDHIPVHHTNEIAQSEAATGHTFSRYWLHNNHMKVDGSKISKSLGNGYTLQDIEKRGFSPMDFRLLVLQSHYQNEANFSFEALQASKNRRLHWRAVVALRWQGEKSAVASGNFLKTAASSLLDALNDNLNTPDALRLVDEALARIENLALSEISRTELTNFTDTVDRLLGLQLADSTPDIDDATRSLITKRQLARDDKNWQASDTLRDDLAAQGINISDTPSGSVWSYSN